MVFYLIGAWPVVGLAHFDPELDAPGQVMLPQVGFIGVPMPRPNSIRS